MSRKIGSAAIRSDNGLLLLVDLLTLTAGRLVSRVVAPDMAVQVAHGAQIGALSAEMYLDLMAELVGERVRWQLLEKLSPVMVVFYVDPVMPDDEIASKLSDAITYLMGTN